MIPIRRSHESTVNQKLKELEARKGETNTQWLKRAGATRGLLLLGGCTLAHFRIRVAQSHLRHDLLPSLWSHLGILEKGMLTSAPLDQEGDTSEVPLNNGIRECPIDVLDNPEALPNIAIIQFSDTSMSEYIEQVRNQRAIIDLPSLIVTWLGFVWGVRGEGNPLLNGHGLPAAAFAETAYGMAGIDLTPGLSTTGSCPEAIWQAAKWWQSFYKEAARTQVGAAKSVIPHGSYCVRQPAAAAVDPKGLKKTTRKR
jgi:hypothetical protein